MCFFFFQAEDGIRDLVRSRGLGDVYKRQPPDSTAITGRTAWNGRGDFVTKAAANAERIIAPIFAAEETPP